MTSRGSTSSWRSSPRSSCAPTGAATSHEIPCSPVKRVLRKLDGEWVTLEQYAERVQLGSAPADRRRRHDPDRARRLVHRRAPTPQAPAGADRLLRLATAATARPPPVRDAPGHRPLRPRPRPAVHLVRAGRPRRRQARRRIARVHARPDDRERLDKIAARIRTAIAELREVDERYDGYGKQTTHGNTRYPAFTVRVEAGHASRATAPRARRAGVRLDRDPRSPPGRTGDTPLAGSGAADLGRPPPARRLTRRGPLRPWHRQPQHSEPHRPARGMPPLGRVRALVAVRTRRRGGKPPATAPRST